MYRHPSAWRHSLDPRDPDYLEPDESEQQDDSEPDDYLTDDELDAAAAAAEGADHE